MDTGRNKSLQLMADLRRQINSEAGSAEVNAAAIIRSGKDPERLRLEQKYGDVYSTDELREIFEVIGFAAPFAVVRRKEAGAVGSVEFQHAPRYYFNFRLDKHG
jgi:hypothetical protein